MFQKRSGKPQKRRGQTNVHKVKIDDNKMKVEMRENKVRTENNEKGKKDTDCKLDDDKRDKPFKMISDIAISVWLIDFCHKAI